MPGAIGLPEMPRFGMSMTVSAELENMALLRKGQRLSVQTVPAEEWKTICKLAGVSSKV